RGERKAPVLVAGGAAAQPRGLVEGSARYQALDALVNVAEPLFQPHDRLAIGGEAEMPGLDNAGMNRTDRDLVEILALGRQEGIRHARRWSVAALPEGVLNIPETEIEPGPGIGQADRLNAIEVADGPFQADGRRMQRPDRGEAPVRARDGDDRNLTRTLGQRGHVHRARVAPQAEQRPGAGRQLVDREAPAILVHNHTRAPAVTWDRLSCDHVCQRRRPSIPTPSRRSGTR